MKELKSSLDTIRRTASEFVAGIEEQKGRISKWGIYILTNIYMML